MNKFPCLIGTLFSRLSVSPRISTGFILPFNHSGRRSSTVIAKIQEKLSGSFSEKVYLHSQFAIYVLEKHRNKRNKVKK